MAKLTFITGNQNKTEYLARQLGISIDHQRVELDEPQSTDLHVIVRHKLEQAYGVVGAPVLVEDVSLSYTALGGLPGPYIRWFIEYAGSEACCRMLDGFDDRSAVVRCTFGYYDGKQIEFFDSEIHGSISDNPCGENGFGFDTFFIMDGYNVTRAELPQDKVEKTYAEEMKPFAKVRAFIATL